MLKKHSQFVLGCLFVVDLMVTAGVWLLAYLIRFHLGIIPIATVDAYPGIRTYLLVLPLVLVASAFAYHVAGLYVPRREGMFFSEIAAVIRGSVIAVLVLMALSYVIRLEPPLSRYVLAFFFLLNGLLLSLERGLARSLLRKARRRGWNRRYVLIVGAGKLGQRLMQRIEKNPWTGFKVIGFIDDNPGRHGKELHGVPVLGGTEALPQTLRKQPVDQLFIALPFDEQHKLKELLDRISDEMVDVRIVPDVFSFVTLNPQVGDFDGMPILSLRESPLHGWHRVIKRAFDMVFALFALFVLAPIMGIIFVLIKAFSPGPVLYAQKRMGMDGKIFRMYKFRTMEVNAEKDTGPVWASEDDPRRTPIGAFLRKYNLDELPQFVNVLLGHMSVVGPRPERPELIKKFRTSIPRYMLRHKMKAGMTGWAQVNGWRGDTSLEKRIQYDLYYIENWSLLFDIYIVFLTIFRRENAY
ncbi:MAG: undecaprenyl-phosphate glucose phosphotransferase [Planctomycetes bacterium]|nr:undecaprenyl-phosphate glucose phosphotransferase [Planctomycetota bacterium]